jgi:excisionase family DNA binding protein
MESHTNNIGPLLTKGEAAERLRISLDTLKKWIAAQRLPVVKLGPYQRSAIRLREADVEAFITAHIIPAADGGSV